MASTNDDPRRSRILSFNRFDSGDVYYDPDAFGLAVNPLPISHPLNCIVNTAVLFRGVRLFGDPNGSEYEVKFAIKSENVSGTYTSVQDDDGVWGYDVMLPEPISIMAYETFSIEARITGPPPQRGNNGKPSVTVDDITLQFSRNISHPGSFRTTTNVGQFYKVFLERQ